MKPMKRTAQLIWNGLLLTFVALFMRGVGVAFQVFIADTAGSEAVGLHTVIASVFGFAVTLATSGIQLGTTRLVSEAIGRNAEGDVRGVRNACFAYALIFGALSSFVLFFGADLIGTVLLKDARTVRSLRILALSLLPIALSSVMNGYFTAVRRVYKNALTGVLSQAIRMVLTAALLLYVFPREIENACVAMVVGSAASEIFSAVLLGILFLFEQRRYRGNAPVRTMKHWRELCGISLPLALSAYTRSGLLSLQHLMIPIGLTAFFGDRSTALSSFGTLHGVVFPLVLFPSAIISSFAGLLVPEIAERRVRNAAPQIGHIVRTVFRVTLLFSVGVAGILLCFSSEISTRLDRSAEAAYYIRVLAPLIPVMYLDTAVDAMLKGHGEQVYCMQVNILDSFLSLVLVVLLLPRFGISGYLFTVYLTEILNATLSITRLLSVTNLRPPLLRGILLPLLAVIGATTCTRLLGYVGLLGGFGGLSDITLHVLLAVLLYFVLLFMLGALRKEEVLPFALTIFPQRTRRS